MLVRGFLTFLLIFIGFDQPKLVKTKIADGLTVSVPAGWRPMDGLDFTERYPSVRAPIAAFTNEERVTDFSVNISATRWPDTNYAMAQEFFRAGIMNMFDKVDFITDGIRTVHGKKFIYFEFESRINGKREEEALRSPIMKYTYIQYYLESSRTLVFSFNAPKRDREYWQPTAHAIMESVKVK